MKHSPLTHVIVTIFTHPSGAKQIVHTYGPFTYAQAQRERAEIIARHDVVVNVTGDLIVKCCKLLNRGM